MKPKQHTNKNTIQILKGHVIGDPQHITPNTTPNFMIPKVKPWLISPYIRPAFWGGR